MGLAWVLPFLYWAHLPPVASLHAEALAFGFAIAAMAAGLVLGSTGHIELPRVGWLPVLLCALQSLQLWLGMAPYPEQIQWALLYVAWAGGCAVLGRTLVGVLGFRQVVAGLSQAVALGSVACVVLALMQYYDVQGIWDAIIVDRGAGDFFGNLGQANHFASYLAMGLASIIYLNVTGRAGAWVAVASAALLLFGLALSGRRSVVIYLALFVLLALLARRTAAPGERRALGWWAVGLLPGLVAAQLTAKIPWLIPELPALTSADRLTAVAAGFGVRFDVWRGAWELFLAHPWLGAGVGGFAHGFYEILARSPDSPAIGAGLFHHAHNLVLQMLAELGILAGLAVVAATLAWFWRFARNGALDATRAWWLSVLGVMAVHSLLEYPFWYAYFLGPAAFLLGGGDPKAWRLRAGWLARGALAATLGLGAVALHNALQAADKLEFEIVLSRSALDPGRGSSQLNASMHRLLGQTLLAPYIELMYARTVPLDHEQRDEKLTRSGRALQFLPLPEVVYRHAALLAMAGQPAAAMAELKQAAAVYPEQLPEFLDGIALLPEANGGALAPLVEWAALEIGTE